MMQFTDRLVKSYEKYAHERASHSPDAFKVQERSAFLKFLQDEERETLLEIGCGPGGDALFFQNQGFRVLAVDNTPTMVKLTVEKGVLRKSWIATISTRLTSVLMRYIR